MPKSISNHGAILLAGCALALIGLSLEPRAAQGGATQQNPLRPSVPAIATADSNNQMIAVTGIDLTGSSVLFLIDTQNKQLAIYQASGGSDSTQGVKLVGARKIDLDLQLEGFNDKSQYSHDDLEKRFAENQRAGSSGNK
jgi:hypothetical protein